MYLDSPDHIYTTHTGSLPRPVELAQAIVNRETGDGPVPSDDEIQTMTQDSVNDVVKHQRDVGIDIISDGEGSKIGYSTYVKERLSGFGGEQGALSLADVDDHPDFAERALGGLVTMMPSCDGDVTYTGRDVLDTYLDSGST